MLTRMCGVLQSEPEDDEKPLVLPVTRARQQNKSRDGSPAVSVDVGGGSHSRRPRRSHSRRPRRSHRPSQPQRGASAQPSADGSGEGEEEEEEGGEEGEEEEEEKGGSGGAHTKGRKPPGEEPAEDQGPIFSSPSQYDLHLPMFYVDPLPEPRPSSNVLPFGLKEVKGRTVHVRYKKVGGWEEGGCEGGWSEGGRW